ncbi:MAG: enoyl-CoA hydratase/isomerase family protein [Ectothiorhodospiraceae bacterium]|nr:enoyl-CoA hydratase/isomerase family protein [Chromatiales bacterium]MCP5157507.1 enoyl-CoA hydratase/isomerase family protein [Ectothiorhodospiraceae bacterium]
MRTEFETIAVERVDEHVLMLVLDRPHAANAIDTQMGYDLRDLFLDLYVDQEDVRCIVLTGRGERAFCAGGDLKERNGMTDADWQRQHALFEQMVRAIRECPITLLGAINGAAYGGGCELTLLTDFAYAARTARFALTEITLGIMPGAMGTQNLPHAVGERRAKEIILTGQPFSAEDALAWGMVNRLCEPEHLLAEAMATARRIAANAPIALMQAKKSMSVATQVDRHTGYQFEIEAYNRMVPTEDRQEGVRAFNEKRRPRFRGR